MTTTIKNTKQKQETKRLARLVFKAKGSQLAAFPSDQWIFSTLKQSYKTDEQFRKGANNIFQSALFTLFNAGAIIGGAALAVTSAPLVGLGLTVLGAGHGLYSALKLKKAVKHFKKDILPGFQKKITNAFARKKGREFKSTFQDRFQKSLEKRKAERVQEEELKQKDSAPQKPSSQEKPMETPGDMAKAAFNFVRKRAGKEVKKRLNRPKKNKNKKGKNTPK